MLFTDIFHLKFNSKLNNQIGSINFVKKYPYKVCFCSEKQRHLVVVVSFLRRARLSSSYFLPFFSLFLYSGKNRRRKKHCMMLPSVAYIYIYIYLYVYDRERHEKHIEKIRLYENISIIKQLD
jgi:hypothetical protein